MKIDLYASKESDFEFAFQVKKEAMGPHIAEKWVWDEAFQLNMHRQRWQEKPWFMIHVNEVKVGTVSIHELDSSVQFGEFYLLDEYQRRGIGTKILCEFLKNCDTKGIKVVLGSLKWNPVRALFGKHGFTVASEDETHCFMERMPLNAKKTMHGKT